MSQPPSQPPVLPLEPVGAARALPISDASFYAFILRAVYRARWSILAIGLVYIVAVSVGMIMAHVGNQFALAQRDALVAKAYAADPASIAFKRGDRLQAALSDFSANLILGAVSNTVQGIAVVLPFPWVAYRGWVGGIVSVDSAHHSRLADPGEAVYYLVTLVLQLIPYSLAGGAGVHLGVSNLRVPAYYRKDTRLLTLPRDALADVLRIYALVIPLFLIASLWEFLAA